MQQTDEVMGFLKGLLMTIKAMERDIQRVLDGSVSQSQPVTVPADNDGSLETFKSMIRRNKFLVLDTETTGLDNAEICQIAIIDCSGEVLLDTYVKPRRPIPYEASRIHGITDDHVINAPGWAQIVDTVRDLLRGRDVVVYNATYDRKIMHQSAEAAGLPKTDWKTICQWWCAMETFAEVYGDWNEYRQSYKWQKLTTAAAHYGLPTAGAHSALADCNMTLGVVKAMCTEEVQS